MADTPRIGAGDLSGEGYSRRRDERSPAAQSAPVSGSRTFGSSGPGAEAQTGRSQPTTLGVGGTTAAAPTENADDQPVAPGGGAKLIAGGVAAAPAAAAGAQILVLLTFINYLKGLALAALALAQNLWNLAMGVLLAITKNVVGGVMAIGGAVSTAVGGGISAVAAGVTAVTAGTTTVVIVVVSAVTMIQDSTNFAMRDGELASCTVEATRALDNVEGSEGDVDQQTLLNAKTVYSVLAAWGMPDENVAGILGNWDAESGVDPTSVQDIFNAPHRMTDEKLSAATNTDKGIGLGQWTYGRNAALRNYAAGHGADWWTLESQLGFMISPAEGSDAEIVKGMIQTSQGTPSTAAIYFHDEWERSADTAEMAKRRATAANKWMALFSGWTLDHTLADSILVQAQTTVGDANSGRVETVRSDCRSIGPAGSLTKEGGLNLEEAQRLMALYLKEGEAFLQTRYGAGGPGDCGYGKADNCVGFSTYFVNKYTTFQQYPFGHGIRTAHSIAEMTGKKTTKVPTAYSVASGPSSVPEGHTFVVLGIEGDQAIIGEAQCGSNHVYTRARMMPLSELTNGNWNFVDVSDLMTDNTAA